MKEGYISSKILPPYYFFQKYIENKFDLDIDVFHAVCHCRVNEDQIRDKHVTEVQFSGFLAQCLKGTYTEKADIVCLLSGRDDGFVPVRKLYQVNCHCWTSLLYVFKTSTAYIQQTLSYSIFLAHLSHLVSF